MLVTQLLDHYQIIQTIINHIVTHHSVFGNNSWLMLIEQKHISGIQLPTLCNLIKLVYLSFNRLKHIKGIINIKIV